MQMKSGIQKNHKVVLTIDCEYRASKSFQEVLISTAQNVTEIPDNYTLQNCMLSQTLESSCFILFLPAILTFPLFPVITVTFLNIMSEPYEQNATML
jgi:hypothetical protein